MMRNYFISISKSSEDKIDVQHLNIDHAYYLSVSDIFFSSNLYARNILCVEKGGDNFLYCQF